MLCEKCHKNTATTHIKTVINGVVTEKNLCGFCAAAEGYSQFANNSFASMLASMFGNELATGTIKETRCSCCGTAFSDIAETGKMGCSECYATFKDRLLPYLRRLHGTTEHTGKRLNSVGAGLVAVSEESKIEQLRTQLLEAIKAEEFEKAAVLRDEIKSLEEGEQK
ncbi:MAG: UvrB/UvrC motif-containing protein [Clostridia bacterium]|nr:UvrB/UvrC motif-containing protein [Clostridia bacterium]